MRAHPRSVAVIGIGNALRGDDAAGLEIARRLRRSELPAGVSVHEHEGEGMTLLELWDAADVALVVDTVRSGTSPGTIHRIDVSSTPVPSSLQRTSSHTIGVAEAIELSRTLGKLPSRVLGGATGRTTSVVWALNDYVPADGGPSLMARYAERPELSPPARAIARGPRRRSAGRVPRRLDGARPVA